MGDSTWVKALLVSLTLGCNASAQLVLKPPIESRCKEAGLRGCDELTDGVLLYVQGDHDAGERQIHRGAAKNEPAKVHEFAIQIRSLKNIPGADDYVGPLLEVANFLAPEDKKPHSASGHDDVAAKSKGAEPEAIEARQIHGLAGTLVPAADAQARPCELYSKSPWSTDSIASRCVSVATGPAVLTDVQTTGACHDVLAIGVGDPQNPRWVLAGGPSTAVSVHGARFPVGSSETLFVVQGMRSEAMDRSAACMLTWAAEK